MSFADYFADILPPQALKAEQTVLGSALLSKTGALKLTDGLKARDFCLRPHQWVYDAVATVMDRGMVPSFDNVELVLCDRDQFAPVGGEAGMTALLDSVESASLIDDYIRIVKQASIRRDLIDVSDRLAALARDPEVPVDEAKARAEALLHAVGTDRQRDGWKTADELMAELLPIVSGKVQVDRGISTGYGILDHMLGGLRKSRLYILAGKTGIGKTVAALNIAHRAAKAGVGVGFFSLEMESKDLGLRLVAMEAQLDAERVDRVELHESERVAAGSAMGRISDRNMHFWDIREIPLSAFRSEARKRTSEAARRGQPIGLIVVDYLQLLQPEGRRERDHRHYTDVAEGLKSMSRELEIPVLALSQLTRAPEKRENKKPTLSDLRESGGIEQAADAAILLYREVEEVTGPVQTGFIVAKNRQGKTGTVHLLFRPEYLEFVEIEERYECSRD